MQRRRRFKQTMSFHDTLATWANEVRQQAASLPPGPATNYSRRPVGRHRAPFGTWGQLARIDTNPHWPEGLMSMHITWGCGSWDVHRNVFVALAFLLDEAVLLRYPRGRSRGR
jgi:hypothetical protein